MSNPVPGGSPAHEMAQAIHDAATAAASPIRWLRTEGTLAVAIVSGLTGQDVRVQIEHLGPTPPPPGSEVAL